MKQLEIKRNDDYLFRNPLKCVLGRIGTTNFLNNSTGVGFQSMRILGSYALVYLLEGNGFYDDENGFHTKVVAGDLLLLFPDVAHVYGPTRTSYWNEFHTVFDGAIFDLWRAQNLLNASSPLFHLEPIERWRSRFASFEDEMRQSRRDQHNALRQLCALQTILNSILATPHQSHAQREQDWLAQARDLLTRGASNVGACHQGLSLPDVARELGMSYESFRKKFTQLSHISPGRYRLTQQMDRACEMLLMGNRNKEVALSLGFCDEYHFSRQFKNVIGLSPREFVRQMSSKT